MRPIAPATSSAGPTFHDNLLTAIERTRESANEEEFVDGILQSITSEVVAKTDRGVPVIPRNVDITRPAIFAPAPEVVLERQ